MSKDNGQSVPLRVAIVGGGIGGLALATFLSTSFSSNSNQLVVDIYEAAPSLTELGAGVAIWLRTWRILQTAASGRLAEGLKGIAPPGRDFTDDLRKAFEFRRGDRSPEGRSFYTMEVPFGALTLHRAEFQRVLARHAIPPAKPHFGKRLVGYEYADDNDTESEIILKFKDGSTARADLLVGADGIRSIVRREVARRLVKRGALKFESCSIGEGGAGLQSPEEEEEKTILDFTEPVWSGTIVYRGLIPLEQLEERFPGHRAGRGPVVYFGKNQHVISYPISSGGNSVPTSHLGTVSNTDSPQVRMVNLVAFVSDPSREGTRLPPGEPWVRPASQQEVLGRFGGWEDEVMALLGLAEKPLAWAIHTVKPLPSYSDSDGRVVLLGDAAHAMTPHQGAGGGQAIEDAYVLASLLSHERLTHETLPLALKAYNTVRVPISQRVVKSSRANGMMYEFNLEWENENSDSTENAGKDADDDNDDTEMYRLRGLADTIMQIHKWEWEELEFECDWGDGQCASAIRTFQNSIMNSK